MKVLTFLELAVQRLHEKEEEKKMSHKYYEK